MGPDRLRYVDPFNLYDLSKPTTLPPSSDSPSKRPSEDTLPPPVTNTPRPVRPSRVQIALYCFLCFIWVACLNIFLVPYLFPYTPNPVINTDIASRLGYKQIEDIPAKFIPGIHDTENKRLVFIGDVHGMYTERRYAGTQGICMMLIARS